MPAYRLVIVDDHPLFRGALNQALSASFEKSEIVEAGSLDELTARLAHDTEVDLVLLDLTMPGVQGLSELLFLRAQYPEIPVVVVSATEDPPPSAAASGVRRLWLLPKSQPVEQIRAAVRRVLNGEIWVPADVDLSVSADREPSDVLSRLSTLTPPSGCACS